MQGLDRFVPPEPEPLIVRCLQDYQLYETLPEPERSAWLLFLAHYLEKLYPDLIDSERRPNEAAAAERELADAITQDHLAEDDSEDDDNDPNTRSSAHDDPAPTLEKAAESATSSAENAAESATLSPSVSPFAAGSPFLPQQEGGQGVRSLEIPAESAIEDDPNASPLLYSVEADFPAPAPAAFALAERRMAETDALIDADPPVFWSPSARDMLAPSVTQHPNPSGVLRSLIDRLRSGNLPLPSPAPVFEPVNVQLDDEPGIRGIPDVLNEQES